jgi:hypothetical protein
VDLRAEGCKQGSLLSQVQSTPFHTRAPWPANLLLHFTLLYHSDKTADAFFTTAEPNTMFSLCHRSLSNMVAKVFYINKINRLKSNLSTNQLQLCEMICLISFRCAAGACFLSYKCQILNLKISLMDGCPSPPYLTGV